MRTTRSITLVKDGERFEFRYRAGQEDAVIDAAADWADDERLSLDWCDAATLSFEIGRGRPEALSADVDVFAGR